MRNKNKLWINFSIIAILLCLSSFICIFWLRNIKNDSKKSIIRDKYTNTAELNRKRELIDLEKKSEKRKLKQVVLCDKDANKFLLKEKLTGKYLIYQFSTGSCYPCVKDDIEFIKKLGKKIDKNKILIFTNYKNAR